MQIRLQKPTTHASRGTRLPLRTLPRQHGADAGPQSEWPVQLANAAALHQLQRSAGNRSVAQLLARQQSQRRPHSLVQRFKDPDTNADVDIKAIASIKKIVEYLDKQVQGTLVIPVGEIKELLDRLTMLVKAEADIAIISAYLESRDTFKMLPEEETIFTIRFVELLPSIAADLAYALWKRQDKLPAGLGKALEEHLNRLKYGKGVALHEQKDNWPPNFQKERHAFFGKLIDASEADEIKFGARFKPKDKRKKGDGDLTEALTREGSAALNLEGTYTSNIVDERSQKSSKMSANVDKEIRGVAGKYDQLYGDKTVGYRGWRGTDFYKASVFKYKYEGMFGTYDEMSGLGPPDFFEYDHQPQHDLIKKAAKLTISQGKKIQDINRGKHSGGAQTIVLAHARHAMGASYGKKTPFEGQIEAIEASTDDVPTKISKLVALLKSATISDADEILAVYADHAKSYGDIDIIPDSELNADGRKALKQEIEARVKLGEAKIKAQDFDKWFEAG